MNRLAVASRRSCLTCGSHVTKRFAHTHGDENNRAHRCPNCDTRGRLANGSAAGREVDHVDPLDQPERFGVSADERSPRIQQLVEARADGGAD
ncbi:DUF7563 family protein [Haloarchaeobius sp. DFWS5]|uniref:DUF7563 family protein n=1 Tax=Haloarchaeobius sp. DFWS5 TaxID=3446114 RepID=UPI003EBA06B3